MRDDGAALAGQKAFSTFSPRMSVYAGTFLISLAILAFEIVTVRTMHFVLGPGYVYFSIAIAMMGLSISGAFFACVSSERWRVPEEYVLLAGCVLTGLSFVACHYLTGDIKEQISKVSASAGPGPDGGLTGIIEALLHQNVTAMTKLGAALCVPYFMFGAVIAYLFSNVENHNYARIYAADLIGAALGSVLAIIAMEYTGYAMSVTLPTVAAILAGAIFAYTRNLGVATVGVLTAIGFLILPWWQGYSDSIEPKPDTNYLITDYQYQYTVKESWRAWNSFTRLGAVETVVPERNFARFSLSSGTGVARLIKYDPNRSRPYLHGAVVPALFVGIPKDALVLFAGAGADMMSLHEHGSDTVTGLEINQLMPDGARAMTSYNLAQFLDTESVELAVSEGRVFLEKDKRRYDAIIYSWDGATAAYYLGSLGSTAQHLYTYEGFETVFGRLKPDGYVLIQNINKIKALQAVRKYMQQRGLGDASASCIIVYRDDHRHVSWDLSWDLNSVLFRPSGWTPSDVERIARSAQGYGYKIAYAPGLPTADEFKIYERLLTVPDPQKILDDIEETQGKRFELVTDDKPFYRDLISNSIYSNWSFWAGIIGWERFQNTEFWQAASKDEQFHALRVKFLFNLSVFSLLLTFIPLTLNRKARNAAGSRSLLVYFVCLGVGFMFLEITLMQKASVLFGHPGISISIILGSMILFAGIGSLMSERLAQYGLSVRNISLMVVAYVIAVILCLDWLLALCLTWPLIIKCLFIALIVAPGAFMMGQLFPRGIVVASRQDKALVPWAWGVNGATSAIAAGATPLVAQAFGFQIVLVIVVLLYGLVAAIAFLQPSVYELAE